MKRNKKPVIRATDAILVELNSQEGKARSVPDRVLATVRTGSYDAATGTLWADVSTADVDRYFSMFLPTSFQARFGNYQRNPVILWAHDHSKPSIGRMVSFEFSEKTMAFKIQFALDDPEGARIARLYEGGFLSAFSVGGMIWALVGSWSSKEKIATLPLYAQDALEKNEVDYVITDFELWEVSACNVPGNPGALKRAIAEGLITAEQARAFGLEDAPESPEEAERGLGGQLCARLESLLEDFQGEIGSLRSLVLAMTPPSDTEAPEAPQTSPEGPPSDGVETDMVTMTVPQLQQYSVLVARAAIEAYTQSVRSGSSTPQ